MKTLLALGFLALVYAAPAQSRTATVHTDIDDDGRTYAISVEGVVNGKPVSYSGTFDARRMTQADKDLLRSRVLDSLGVGDGPMPPAAPPAFARNESAQAETEQDVTFTCPTCTGRMRLEVYGQNYVMTRDINARSADRPAFPLDVALRPGRYRYVYWQNGVQQMELPFEVKAGEQTTVTVK